jgi:hypothetical protein
MRMAERAHGDGGSVNRFDIVRRISADSAAKVQAGAAKIGEPRALAIDIGVGHGCARARIC